MGDPRREQLRERDAPERRMLPLERQLRTREAPAAQGREVRGAQRLELIEQLRDALAFALVILREAIVRLERLRGPVREDHAGARDPVGALTMNQVAEVVERAEGVGPLVASRPCVRQAAEQRTEGRGRAREDLI